MKLKKLILTVTAISVLLGVGAKSAMAQDNTQSTSKVLILLAHPQFEKSKANKAMIAAVENIKNVEVVDIYSAPFTVEYYKPKVEAAEIIVFQFPFYWASAPSQMKKWTDEIFMAMAPSVNGKKLMVATTTGSEYEAYRSGGRNKFTMDELLRPYQMQANHSGMIWQTPFVLYGTALPDGAKAVSAGAKEYKKIITELAK